MKQILLYLFVVQLITFSSCTKSNSTDPTPQPELNLPGILSTLQKDHPRLLLTDARLGELKTLSKTDNKLARYAGDVVTLADKDVLKLPIEHILIGPR